MIQWDGPAPIRALAFSPDSIWLAVVCANGSVQVLDPYFTSVVQAQIPAFNSACGLCWRMDSRAIEVFQGNHILELPVEESNDIRLTSIATRNFGEVVWAANQLQAVVDGNYLRFFDTRLGKFTALSHIEQHGIKHLSASPATKTLAWTTNNRLLRTWRFSTSTKFDIGLDKLVGPVAFTTDGQNLAVGTDWSVRIYGLNQKLPKCELVGHQGRVTALSYQANRSLLLTCSWDQTVRYWDTLQAREVAKFPLQIGVLNTLSQAPDGTRVAVGGSDGNLIVIDLE